MKTSEVFKKTFGSLSDTVREVGNRRWVSSENLHLSAVAIYLLHVGKYIPLGF